MLEIWRNVGLIWLGLLMAISTETNASDSIDSDADGVSNLVDDCPLSPRGSKVDSSGCALDEDTDGIADGLDRCPGTRFGVAADSLGCAAGQRPLNIPGIATGSLRAAVPVSEPDDDDDEWWSEAATRQSVSAPTKATAAIRAPTTSPVISNPAQATLQPPKPVVIVPQKSTLRDPAPVVIPRPAPAPSVVSRPAASAAIVAQQTSSREVRPRIVQRIEPDRSFFFEGRESEISQTMAKDVRLLADKVRQSLEEDPELKLIISGHGDIKTDGMGADDVAAARAASIQAELEDAGIAEERIVVQVPGIFEPRYYGEELSKNARVEIRLTNRIRGDSVRPPLARGPVNSSPGAVLPGARPLSSLGLVSQNDVEAVSKPVARSQTSVSVVFKYLGAALDTPSRNALRGFLESQTRFLLADPNTRLSIRGGTGVNESGPQANRLAASRAATVKNYLEILGLPRNRVDLSVDEQPRHGGQRVDVRLNR